jgi:hypothetical protein
MHQQRWESTSWALPTVLKVTCGLCHRYRRSSTTTASTCPDLLARPEIRRALLERVTSRATRLPSSISQNPQLRCPSRRRRGWGFGGSTAGPCLYSLVLRFRVIARVAPAAGSRRMKLLIFVFLVLSWMARQREKVTTFCLLGALVPADVPTAADLVLAAFEEEVADLCVNVVHATRWWVHVADSCGYSHASGFLNESGESFHRSEMSCHRVGIVKASVGSGRKEMCKFTLLVVVC